tara:strand:+ start:174 stop:1118 length:945 start_codon:yes stop_codon:yes gene_type:complete
MSEKIKLKFSSPWDSAETNNTRVLYNWGDAPECFELTHGNDYDYLIVMNHSSEMYTSPREKNIAVTMEPTWSPNSPQNLNDYCKYIITCDKKIKGDNVYYTFPFLFTHDSRNDSNTDGLFGPTVKDYLDNDSFPENIDCPDYSKKISFIVANHGTLGGAPQHELSNYCIRENLLLNILNSDLDVDIYGKGWSINDSRYKGAPPLKKTALKNYKYSICMENSCEDLYISEKFFDCVLNNCIPIYYGCKNITEAYNPDSFIIFDPTSKNVIDNLKNIINEPVSWRLEAVRKAKNDYYGRHNLLKYLENFIKNETSN